MIFIDNDLVFQKMRRMWKTTLRIPNCQKDPDLWKDLQNTFHRVRHLRVSIIKVVSHQDLQLIDDEVEMWVARGNSAADRIATAAIQSNPTVFSLWQQYHREVQQISIFRTVIHKVFLQSGSTSNNS